MGGVVVFALIAAAFGGFAWVALRKSHRDWVAVCQALGFQPSRLIEGSYGTKGALKIRRMESGKDSGREHTKLVVEGAPGCLGFALATERDGLMAKVGKLMLGEDIQIGDAQTDAGFLIRGDELRARAALDANARQTLQRLHERGIAVQMSEQALQLVHSGWFATPESLADAFSEAIALFRHLCVSEDLALTRLRRLASEDPHEGVRRESVSYLARKFIDVPGVDEVLREAAEDPAPAVRLEAALALGPPAEDVVLGVIAAEGASLHLRDRALEWLAGLPHGPDRLAQVLTSRAPEVATMPRGSHAQLLEIAALSHLRQRLPADAPVAVAEEALAPCLTALTEALAGPLALLAVEGLAGFGGREEVEPLRELSADDDLRRAAQAAVRAIQSRLEGESGGLALAEDSGGLSVAEPVGALSPSE